MATARTLALLVVSLHLVLCSHGQSYWADSSPGYNSIIRPLVRSVYWAVSNEQSTAGGQLSGCTNTHLLNITTGDVLWMKEPVDSSQQWSEQLTDKRAFFTLRSGGPALFSVSLESGKPKWSWPPRKGFFIFKRWDLDLPQASSLAAPLPVPEGQLLLVKSSKPEGKVYAIDISNGTQLWEWDAWAQMETATTGAGGHAALPGSLRVHQIIAEWAARTAYVSVSIRTSCLGLCSGGKGGKVQQQRGAQGQGRGAGTAAVVGVETEAAAAGEQGGMQHALQYSTAALPQAASAAIPRKGLSISSVPISIASSSVSSSGGSSDMADESSDSGSDGGGGGEDSGSGDDSGDTDDGDDSDDDGGKGEDPETEEEGWVWALSLDDGSVRWWSGPVESGISHMVLTDTVLLVASRPDEDEEGLPELQGVNKTTGAMLYSLECGDAARGCRVDVSDSKVALLTTSLTTPPLSMETLSAFDLATGKTLWHGVSGSSLAVQPNGSCTAIAAPHKDLWFACTCNPDSAAATPPAQEDSASAARQQGVEAEGSLQRRRKPHHDDVVGRTGLCAYAVSSSTGKLLSESLLSSHDAAPVDAALYGLGPLVLADQVVFPGQAGVYSVPRLSPTADNTGSARIGPASGSKPSSSTLDPSYSGSPSAAMSSAPAQKAAGTVHGSNSSRQAVGPPPLLFSLSLPVGVAIHGWDMMDLKDGVIVVRASPDESCLNNSPPPPAANTSQSPPPASGLSATSTESRATSAATHISNGGVQAYYSDLGAVPGFEADLGRRRRRKRDPRAYQSAMLGISASNGSLLWQRTFNASLAPAAVRPLPHDLGRGGLMLIDGCVPPTTYISDDSAKKNDSSRPKGSVGRGIGGSQGGSVWQEVWGLLKRAVHPPRKHHHGTTKAASEDDSAENDPWPWEQHGNAGRHTGQQGSAGSSRSGSRQSRQLRAVAGQQLEHLQEGSVGDSASTSNSENPDGTVCCLYAVVMATGKVKWRYCFDVDRACRAGLARDTAQHLVEVLLVTQFGILFLGFGSAWAWRCWRRRQAAALARAGVAPPGAAVLVTPEEASYESD